MNKLKIIIVAFSVKGAMGQYLHSWLKSLGHHCDLYLFCPSHYEYGGENYTICEFNTSKNRFLSLIAFLNIFKCYRLSKDISHRKPNLVHLFNGEGYPWSFILMWWLKKIKIPFIVTVHDARPHSADLFGYINHFMRKYVLSKADGIHVHTNNSLEELKRQGLKRGKIFLVPHGNIGGLFLELNNPNNVNRKKIIFFGRIEKYKGIDIFIKACSLLEKEFEGKYEFVIAGPGKMRRLERRLLRELKLGSLSLINRYLSNKEVAELFSQSAVCVLPYRDATQTSVLGISAAFGVPIVATNVGGFKEDVPRTNGILVRPNDPNALAVGIKMALKSQVKYPYELEFDNLAKEFLVNYKNFISR